MTIWFIQPSDSVKKSCKNYRIFGILFLAWLCSGCSGNESIKFDTIEHPAVIRTWGGNAEFFQENLTQYQIGAVRTAPPLGLAGRTPDDIWDITGMTAPGGGVMMNSIPRGENSYAMEDLSGVAFHINLEYKTPNSVKSWEEVLQKAVLEFRFPKANGPGPSRINWVVTPHLICRYLIESTAPTVVDNVLQGGNHASLYFEYVFYEDPLGTIDLYSWGETAWETISAGTEGQYTYIFLGDMNDTLVALHDERSGTMIVPVGIEAKLFVGVVIQIRTTTQGDRVSIGGELPMMLSDPNRCTFAFGSNSYYTMGPLDN